MKPPPFSPHIKPLDFVLPEMTGHRLLLLRELVGVDCDKEVARAMCRLAAARYWHFRLLEHAAKYTARPQCVYLEQLQAGRVLCSPRLVFSTAYHMRLCLNHMGEARLGGGVMNPDDASGPVTEYKGWLSCVGHQVDVTFCAACDPKLPRIMDVRFYTDPSRCFYTIETVDEQGQISFNHVRRRALQL
jgi:hypothetical protein